MYPKSILNMGVLKNGPNGGFSGKAGSVVGSSWKDIEYIRGLPRLRTSAPKVNEVKNRKKFALTQDWLKELSCFFTIGLMNYSGRMTAYNAAISLNKNAIRFDGEQLHIDYPSIILSHGNLPIDENPVLTITNGQINLKWEAVSNSYLDSNDELLFACYSPERKVAFFSIGQTDRQSSRFEMEVSKFFAGKTVEAYMAFCSRDRKRASISRYLGQHIC